MSITANFEGVSVLCIGDVMLDRYVTGAVKRISPESPVPILSVSGFTVVAGGAANVARNIASLGGRCTLIGVVGRDAAAAELERLLVPSGRIETSFVAVDGRPTTEKVRFVAQGQQMLRSDSEDTSAPSREVESSIMALVEAAVADHDVVVLSDYGKGVVTPGVARRTIEMSIRRGKPVIVDPKTSDLSRYDGATLVTPNLNEVMVATGVQGSDDASVVLGGKRILATTQIVSVLVTRSEKGMTLLRREEDPIHIPTAAREVADVVGAGDTVVAALSLAIGAGGDLTEAAHIANAAAGIVVAKSGTATVSHTELFDELERHSDRGLVGSQLKTVNREQATAQARAWRRDGLKVGFTNGCFDIIHVGHIGILEYSRAHCDRLIVGVNSDVSVRRLKGASRPINGEEDRARLIAALAVVDLVVVFDEDTPLKIIEAIKPDTLVKGADYQIAEIVGADSVLARGGQVLRFAVVPERSTTNIIRGLKKSAANP